MSAHLNDLITGEIVTPYVINVKHGASFRLIPYWTRLEESCDFVVGWLQWLDLLEIVAYIARDNPNAAQELNLTPNG